MRQKDRNSRFKGLFNAVPYESDALLAWAVLSLFSSTSDCLCHAHAFCSIGSSTVSWISILLHSRLRRWNSPSDEMMKEREPSREKPTDRALFRARETTRRKQMIHDLLISVRKDSLQLQSSWGKLNLMALIFNWTRCLCESLVIAWIYSTHNPVR